LTDDELGISAQEAHEHERRSMRVGRILQAAAVFAAIVGMAVSLVILLYRQQTNHAQQAKQNQILQILVDCTTPGHSCYVKSNQRTGELLQEVERIILLANYCSSKPENHTIEAVSACVKTQLGH
jgi:hypothetical protein